MRTILYSEAVYDDPAIDHAVFASDFDVRRRDVACLADLDEADCEATEGLMLFRHFMRAEDFERFPRLKGIVRMGVGFDRIDRAAAAERGIVVCNCPDYATTEVADHAISLALALRRGLLLHHDAQRREQPAAWAPIEDVLLRRLSTLTFGVVGLGRIGTTAALRAKAFGCRVAFFDPYVPSGMEQAFGFERHETLEGLLGRTDILSLHVPLTGETRNFIGEREIAALPKGAVIVNTARGPVLDVEAAGRALKAGHLSGLGLDVLPVEPPMEPLPELLDAYRRREPWVEGRLIVTPHAAFVSPEAMSDAHRNSALTMRAMLNGEGVRNEVTHALA